MAAKKAAKRRPLKKVAKVVIKKKASKKRPAKLSKKPATKSAAESTLLEPPKPRKKTRRMAPGRERAHDIYVSDPDMSINRVAKIVGVPYGRVAQWVKVEGWQEERAEQREKLRLVTTEALIDAAKSSVETGFLQMIEESQKVRKLIASRLIEDLEAESAGTMDPFESITSKVVHERGADGKILQGRPPIVTRLTKRRRFVSEKLALAFLASDEKWTQILLGLTLGTKDATPGAHAGTDDAAKVVRKLQAASAAIEAMDNPPMDVDEGNNRGGARHRRGGEKR